MIASTSVGTAKWQTPLRRCTRVPPRSLADVTCPVTSRTTAGPVRNMLAASVMRTKSVSAGE
jgi:hypothetical protein